MSVDCWRVCTWVWASGKIGGEEFEGTLRPSTHSHSTGGRGRVHLNKPHEAGAKHGLCSGKHSITQCVDGGKGACEVALEVVRHRSRLIRVRRETAEEEMVVVGH
jgi:hypothetical protein